MKELLIGLLVVGSFSVSAKDTKCNIEFQRKNLEEVQTMEVRLNSLSLGHYYYILDNNDSLLNIFKQGQTYISGHLVTGISQAMENYIEELETPYTIREYNLSVYDRDLKYNHRELEVAVKEKGKTLQYIRNRYNPIVDSLNIKVRIEESSVLKCTNE